MAEIQREFHDFDPSLDPSSPKRKHKIYISHSKQDCSYFARLLAAELQSMSYDAFLCENTISSDIEEVIMQDCRLVVFVLSEQFFKTHSLMGELEAFVGSKVSQLPVFYNFNHLELKDPRRRAVWKEVWHGFMQEKDWAQAKIAKWECAMEELGSCDGINYNSDAGSPMGCTQAICKAVCERVPLQVYWSKKLTDIGTENLIQICKVADKWFDDPSALHGGARVVGLHGVWGVGKTTLGKALCNFYSSEFGGRVCYLKLQIESSILKLERIKKVLRKLMGMSQYFLEEHVKDLDQAYTYLSHETPRKVFLVVDNLEDLWESQEEAADLFLNRSPFHLGSKVLVLARSPHTLLKLLWPLDNLCRNIKSFEHLISSQLAKNMFLKALGGLPESKDRQSVEENTSSDASMICKQWVQAQKFILQEHMHPLFLVSLGYFLRQNNSDFWHSSVERLQSKEHLKKPSMEDDFFLNGLFKMVFDVLQETQETYDSLEPMEQELFLDVALYMPRKEVLWLQQLHDQSSGEMFSATFKCLRKLRTIEFLRTENRMIQVHKLCKLYATMVLTKQRMLYLEGEIKWGHLQDTLRGSADVLERIAFENCVFETDEPSHHFIINLSACDRVRVLRMCGIYSRGAVQVELGSIKLRSLDLCSNHAPILISGDLSYLKCLAGVAETLSSQTISLAWTSPPYCADNFESLKVLKLSKGPACNSLTSKDLKEYRVGIKLEVLWLNCIPFSGALHLDVWSKLKELTVCNIDPGLRGLEGLKQLHSLRMLHLLYVKSLQRLPGLESMKKLKNIHVIGCKDLWELKLPGSKLLSHCCIWKCKNLKGIFFEKVEEVEYSFEDDIEEDIDEITRLPYDGISENVPPCWECSDAFVCSGGDLDDSFQDRYKEYMSRKQEKGLIYSSDEKKFFVYGCAKLEEVMGLSELTSIKEFILREQQYKIARLQVVRPEFLELDCDTESQLFRFSYLKFVDAACLSHLSCLSVQDVKVKGFVKRLLKQLEIATTLKSLLVRCDVSGKCECSQDTPVFSFLSKDLAELTYSCCCVDDLASIGECTGLINISLVDCIGVKKWPDFSKLSLLSSVNMGALVLPDRLTEGQFQKSKDIEASQLSITLQSEDLLPEVGLSVPKSMSERPSESMEALSSPTRHLKKSEDRMQKLALRKQKMKKELLGPFSWHKSPLQKIQEGMIAQTSQKTEYMGPAQSLHKPEGVEAPLQDIEEGMEARTWLKTVYMEPFSPPEVDLWHVMQLHERQGVETALQGIERGKAQTWKKTEYMGPSSSPAQNLEGDCWRDSQLHKREGMEALLSPDSWLKVLSENSEVKGAISLLNCLLKGLMQECVLWCEPPISCFGSRECHGLGILTLPKLREKDSHWDSMTWEWLGLHSMPWQELVKASQPGLDDVFRIAPSKVVDFPSDLTNQKMVLGGFFSKTSRNIHLCRGQTLSALCRTLDWKWRLAMLELSNILDWIPTCSSGHLTLSTSGIMLKGKDFDWKFNLDDHIANDDGELVIRGGFFSRTCKEIEFENGILSALCQEVNGGWKWAMLDLDLYITNNDGTLLSREENGQLGVKFMSSCHSITLSNTTELHGYARCRDLSWKPFRVNLDYNVENEDGHLVWHASPNIRGRRLFVSEYLSSRLQG